MKVTNTHARLIVAAVLAATASGTNAIAGELRLTPGVNEVPTKETDPKAPFTREQVVAALADVEGVEIEAAEAVKTETTDPDANKTDATKTGGKGTKAASAPAPTPAPTAAPVAGAGANTGAASGAPAGAGWAPAKT